MAIPGIFGRFFGRTASEAAGFAAGVATGPVLSPIVEEVRIRTWAEHPSRPIEADAAAEIVAEDVEQRDWGAQEAAYNGVNGDRFDALTSAIRTAPGFPTLMDLRRRNVITAADFEHGLRKARLETRWDDSLANLLGERLSPAQIALGIIRSIIPDPGFMPVDLNTAGGVVPAYQTSDIDPVAEAAAAGIDHERLRVMVGEIGLPMSVQQAASAFFRGIIQKPDYYRAVVEGDTRPEWADPLLEQAREIPSTAEYTNLYLRGWITDAEFHAGVGRHGMSADDAERLYLAHGRPVTTRQAFLGYVRGGRVAGESWDERETFRRAVVQSDIRPEWEPILWAQRYTYPTAFVLRALTQAGDLSGADAEQILTFEGWEPTLAAKVAAAWAGGGGTTADAHIGKAQSQLWSRTHTSYVNGESDAAAATPALEAAGVPAGTVPQILALWDHERDLVRKQLTAAQIKKAYKETIFTHDEAVGRLVSMGYSLADATTFLNE